jgi:calcineurin-like phosphoesterase family protein
MNYFTADLHFNHSNIIEYCNRPFKHVKNMNNVLVRNFNSLVTNNDNLYIVGDLMMGNKDSGLEYVKQLKGNKYLILGNHDNFTYEQIVYMGIKKAYKYFILTRIPHPILMAHDPIEALFLARTCGFDCKPIILNGHVHDTMRTSTDEKTGNVSINVGVDCWNFFPCTGEQIEDVYKTLLEG